MTKLLTLLLVLSGLFSLSAQTPTFKFLEAEYFAEGSEELYRVSVDMERLEPQLQRAPAEFQRLNSKATVKLPLPNGSFADFRVFKSPLIPNHPELGSYKIHGPWGGGRMAISAKGIHVMAKGPTGYFMVTPVPEVTDQHRVSSVRDYLTLATTENLGELSCGNTSDEVLNLNFPEAEIVLPTADKSANDPQSLHIYDMALTCTGEFAQNFGGTTAAVQDAFNVVMNLINAIYENDLGIRINLLDIPGLIYLNPDTDPYSESDNGFALLDQIQPALDSNNVASASYDLAHIIYSGCSGLLGVAPGLVCNDAEGRNKIQGASCIRSGGLEVDAIGTMAHEIGHQFSGSHTWSRCGGNNGGGWADFAVEPGGGNTIMAYGEICDDQSYSGIEPYFHSISVEQIGNYTRLSNGAPCATIVETDNLTPIVDFVYENDFVIPVSTPFRLEGQATDSNNDALTFSWEQFDTDRSYSGLGTPEGNAPIFRSATPTTEGWRRYFPRLDLIVQNRTIREERLPTYSRDLTFRLTARDNNVESGGADWKQMNFRADEAAGPFLVNNPDSSIWLVGDYMEVTWEVASTNLSPVNCKRVNILLSTDGGQTFDLVLAENVANNGGAFVTVPEALSTEALIMVEAADNIFLNVNQNSFQVLPAVVPGYTLEPSIRFDEVCLPEVIDIDLNSGSILDFAAPIALSVDTAGVPAGAIVSFSSPELTPGETSTMSVDLSNVRLNGTIELTIIAVAEGLDTARRTVLLDVTDNDYSDLATIAPAEGTAGIILATTFDWTDAVNADTYEIEIGTSPTFQENTIFERAIGLTNSQYLPIEFFDANTLYFWRIRPLNSCGLGPWSAPKSFRTINSACNAFTPDDVPVGLPGSGPSFTRESRIFIEQGGAISDLNIPNVNIQYNFAS
ncbi:reprolysin-like metallopeptidase, partial [Neolewinella persica]|uniref:reprolysin-like metallopeptidase n=1 Tax=Neolewinella persica TaxID=70998 RepID=UPI00036BF58A